MMRRILFPSLLLALSLGTLVAWKKGYTQDVLNWGVSRFTNGHGTAEIKEIEREAETAILVARARYKSPPLQSDSELKSHMEALIGEVSTPNLDLLLANMEKEMPQYLQMAVASYRCLSLSDLLDKLTSWKELPNPDFTHSAVLIRRTGLGVGWTGFIITGYRAEELTPENVQGSNAEPKFYSKCTLCQHTQSCQIPRQSRSIFFRCGHCNQVYSAMAADAQGRFRYVNEYLTGYFPPAHFPDKISKLQELMIIWQTVTRTCRYVADEGENDAWQTALQTQMMGQGDCEDSSILLSDWLINRGFDARVALGRFAERGGHAWVVVRLDGQTYLLESTEGARANRPPLLSEVGSRYTPDLLFDRDGFFIQKKSSNRWNDDYWSDKTWQKVIPRPNPSKTQLAAEISLSDKENLVIRKQF